MLGVAPVGSDEGRFLQIEGLRKRFGRKVVLDGIDMTCKRGDVVVITGPSGCGKSTLLRCINRLVQPDGGKVIFDGTDVMSLDYRGLLSLRSRIGFVFQHFNLVRRLSVFENVLLGAEVSGLPRGEAGENAERALGRVGIGKEMFYRKPDTLSGGEQQRVAIARALAMKPELMLWDEPTASLDPILVGEALDVIEDLIHTEGITMVLVTHEMDFARRVATRLLLMESGSIIEEGDPETVLFSPSSELGKRYAKLVKGKTDHCRIYQRYGQES